MTQVFPSGWEIHNARLEQLKAYSETNVPTYQDIRDDRVMSYFDMEKHATHIYRVQLNAAYLGRYYLPTTSCEAMYDAAISARVPGQWVTVVPSQQKNM